MVEIAALAAELAGETRPGEVAASSDAAAPVGVGEAGAAAEAAIFGTLDADQRIRAVTERTERTLWASAIFVTLLYAAIIAAQVMDLGGLSALEHELQQQEKERRGQESTSISVELVPDPDKNAKTEKWRDGAQGPDTPAPPQPQQMPSPPVPEVEAQKPVEQPLEQPEKPAEQPTEEQAKEEPTEDPTAKEQGESGTPTLPDLETLVDAAASDLNAQIKSHYDRKPRKPRPQQQAMYSGGGMQVRGTGASGKSDEFSKSVIAALMKTRPGPFALWGRVLVSFQITQQGDLLYVRVLHSSGNKALDEAAVNAIHKAQFRKPPSGLSPEARTYIIDYIFG
jgi:TonB family protein